MKKINLSAMIKTVGLLSSLVLTGQLLSAQLFIGSGAQLAMTGNARLTLQNMDLVNHGNFIAGNGTVLFTGNAAAAVRGSQPIQFYELGISKNAGTVLSLQRSISVTNRISFNTGFLELNGFDIDLGTTGILQNEQQNSRITGATGGSILFSTTLNLPVNANPGNLGAIISSSQNLGSVTIRRGHQTQINQFGNGNSILRYYDIIPQNNSGLNATLRFHYFDAELNGLDENSLVLWKSNDNLHWSNQGFSSRNTGSNYVEQTGISGFSRWTLSTFNNPLPVQLELFNLRCDNGRVLVRWRTTQETNSSHFLVQRSVDGGNWTNLGTVPAAGSSQVARNYSMVDQLPLQHAFYRIAQHDQNGRVEYSQVLRFGCGTSPLFTFWPNPVNSQLFVVLSLDNDAPVYMQLYDSKGSLVRRQALASSRGLNQFVIDLANLTPGVYHLNVREGGFVRGSASIIKN